MVVKPLERIIWLRCIRSFGKSAGVPKFILNKPEIFTSTEVVDNFLS